jgi:hypothetical protein
MEEGSWQANITHVFNRPNVFLMRTCSLVSVCSSLPSTSLAPGHSGNWVWLFADNDGMKVFASIREKEFLLEMDMTLTDGKETMYGLDELLLFGTGI